MTIYNKTIFRQADSRWGSLPYPTSTYKFAGNGCGCCAVTHCAIELENFKNYTPADVRKYMVQFATKGNGTLWNGITKGLEHYGFNVHWRQADTMTDIWKVLKTSLKKGVILFGSAKGGTKKITWTTGGHYVAFVDWKYENGDYWFYCKDSGGRKHDGWYSYKQHMAGDIKHVWICTSLKSGYRFIGSSTTTTPTPSTPTTTKYVTYSGAFPIKTIKRGSKGTQVTRWQKYLRWMGYSLDVDGSFGGITRTKTLAAQKKLGFTGKSVDGIVGSKTIAKAKAYKKPVSVSSTTPTTSSTPLKKCIDVSRWQGEISQANWAKVKKTCDYAICRASYTSQSKFSLLQDSTFATNFTNAQAAGLRVGAYHYSQAITVDEAKKEAEFLCNILKNYTPTFYVVCDFEYGGRLNSKIGKKASDIANAFCDVVKAHGYYPCIYANTSTLNSALTNPKYPVWVAQYASACTYKGAKVMWQYTSSGSVEGISGRVDLSYVYQACDMPVQTKVESYSGALPDWVELSGNIITTTAKKLAYPKGTSKAKYTYGKGKATAEFTKAINQVFPKRSSWSKQCQAGASCDVGAATILRYCGASTTIPRGLQEQIPFMKGNSRYKDMKIASAANFKAGDVGIYLNKKSGGHIWIYVGDGVIAEANHTTKYFEHLIARKYTSSNKKYFACFRMVVPIRTYIQRGDTGSEIVKLQKFLNWAGYDCGAVDGSCGAKTENSIMAFQKAHGLVADGKYGVASQAKAKEFKKVTTIKA